MLEILFDVRRDWDGHIEFQSMSRPESEAAKLRVLQGILTAYFSNVNRSVVFDKSRGWLYYIEMAETILERKVKIIVPVRDLRDVLASFEKIWRANKATSVVGQEQQFYFDFQTVEGRCEVWTRLAQPIGLAYNRIKDALQRGYQDRLFFVDYDQLTANPERTLKRLHEFLEEPAFEYDFEHVEQVTVENDATHIGMGNLHTIRPVIAPQESRAVEILGKTVADKYRGTELW